MKSKSIKSNKLSSTQKYLNIAEIKDNVVVFNDGSLKAVLLVSSINFALKSEEEQEAIVQNYVSFLNSLRRPIQVIIQSRLLNIDYYLLNLEQIKKEIMNELLKTQITDYIQFIRELIKLGDIMSKRFYVVISYNPLGDSKKGFFAQTAELFSSASKITLDRKKFEKYKIVLLREVSYIISGLSSMGIKSIQLDTQSLIELFYNSYNFEVAQREKLETLNKLRVEEE
ncbi:hypothetical protein CVV26_03345 [Candidatus Kuenenbacteria bacterium HGW-Kuenenbacteria-1]|uniref:Uncharacterized protein n=1 Tax=Candidatus Kuenenbacteria bacterium HGW-Kuenenbacteria-1 TaxID=2013812 RepID=A0A2N1UMR7_9BACT|nr:MAG: hypothetical protein CVV26_03345 [Candidatus Kuenenbacteria bacterium HGW-Kuenenbacteria-1]